MDPVSVDFKAAEVFDLARQMESGGGEFYRHAALKIQDPAARALILKFAAMEEGHYAIFGKLKDCYLKHSAAAAEDRAVPLSDYLRSWVRGYVFTTDKKPLERLEGMTRSAEILRLAMELEKDAIAFYTGLREMVRQEDRWVINRIIDHELMHLTTLGRILREDLPPGAVDDAVPEFTCDE